MCGTVPLFHRSRATLRWLAAVTGFITLLAAVNPGHAQNNDQDESLPFLLSGEIFSENAQLIFVPVTENWNTRISWFAPEGSLVKAGEPVVKFDGSSVQAQLDQQREQHRAQTATQKRERLTAEKQLLEARFQLRQAERDLALAEIDAAVPEQFLGKLTHAENQLKLEQSSTARQDAAKLVADKQEALTNLEKRHQLDAQKRALARDWLEQQLQNLTVDAQRAGYVLYESHPWSGAKVQLGDTVQTGFKVAQVADTQALAVRVWINGVDQPHITAPAAVRITFDAFPDKPVSGELRSISAAGERKAAWGDALYFTGDVSLSATADALVPGMSALVAVEQ